MRNRLPFMLVFSLYNISLFSMNYDNDREFLTEDNTHILIKYPQTTNREINSPSLAVGTIDQKEIEEITHYHWCPNPYSNRTCCFLRYGCCGMCSGISSIIGACEVCAVMGLYTNPHDTPSCNQLFCNDGNWGCTVVLVVSFLSGLYGLMPWHNENGCNLYKKVVTKVLRRRIDTQQTL